MKLHKKYENAFINLFLLIRVIIQTIIYRKKVYIMSIPIHGNLGDQAILEAEKKFIKENMNNIKVIEVNSFLIAKYLNVLKKIVNKKSLIFCHGGGFLGTIWEHEEKFFRMMIKTFKENKIIVFPQTIYFSDDELGKKMLSESIEIYQQHPNLYICCREIYSYEYMKKHFKKCNILLIPDMVLYLDEYDTNKKRDNILFCIRKDKEKIDHTESYEHIKQMIKKYDYKIDYTDTVIEKQVYWFNRKKVLIKKFNQFSGYKMIVTDRLHGMVFALLTKTPCVVFENKSYKIKGVYKWIENINYIKLIKEGIEENELKKLIESCDKLDYDNSTLKNKYEPLIQLIKQNL